MASSNPPSPTVTCAENIALLHLLHSVPAQPCRNPTDSLLIRQGPYTLSFLQERRLAGTLAFLSNLKDGPEHIPAVCVEEASNSASLNVLLAVNESRPGDGTEVLQDLRLGFERIFAVLSRASHEDGTPVAEDHVFAAIISMCSMRILCRLRFISNSKNSPKQPIKELLQEALNAIRQPKTKKLWDSKLLSISILFAERAKEVIKLVDAWAKHRTATRLRELVEGVHRLWRVGELQALLGSIPNKVMDPSSRKNLLNTVSKVARYREAARFLYRTAKKIPLIRRMNIVLVSLPEIAFQQTLTNQYVPTLPSAISKISAPHAQGLNVSQICRLLDISEDGASDRFTKRTRKTLNDAKIHGEIQLLFHCELSASMLPPRVVCSTKDACFLCNAFISMQGKMHTPRCHGRLYPGWRLPFAPRLKLEERFNKELENYIRNSVTTLLARREKTFYPDPNESTLLTLPWSESTIRSLALPETIVEEKRKDLQHKTLDRPEEEEEEEEEVVEEEEETVEEVEEGKDEQEKEQQEENISIPSKPESLSGSSESVSSNGSTAQIGEAFPQPLNEVAMQSIISTPSSCLSSSSESASFGDYTLLQGQILSKFIRANRTSPLYTTGSLEVQIEYSTGLSPITPRSHPSKLSYSVEWLTADETERVLVQHPTSTFSAGSLEGELSLNLDDMPCFYITAKGSTLKVLLQSSITETPAD